MIIDLNLKLLELPEKINLNQLVFLSMVLNKNQKYHDQDVRKLVSLISDDEISYLIQNNLITSMERGGFTYYNPSKYLKEQLTPKREYFDVFFDMYPVYITRPDGTKSFLRSNKNRCRELYNQYVHDSEDAAKHLLECLNFDIQQKTIQGKLGYMKTMYRWLIEHCWEIVEEEMKYQQTKAEQSYGTELL